MKKLSIVILLKLFLISLIYQPTFAELIPSVNDLSASIENKTNYTWVMGGIRFRNEGFNWIDLDNGYVSEDIITNTPIGSRNEVTIVLSSNGLFRERKLSPGAEFPFDHKWVSSFEGSSLDTTFIPEILVKTGTVGSIEKPMSASPITLEMLDSIIKTLNYYNSSYRYDYIDSLGVNGGVYSGGFLDTWYNVKNNTPETQIQIAIPIDTFTINNFGINIDTSTTMGPLYWMALAMGQEYFDVDLQFLMTVGIKEGNAGVKKQFINNDVFYDSTTNHYSGIGPWQVEQPTACDRALGYPHFFPKYNLKLSSAIDLGSSGIHWVDFSDYYCGVNTHINSAKIVNSMFFYIIGQYYQYDVLTYSTDICWKDALEITKDPYMGLCAMSAVYNGGNSKVANIAGDLNSNSYEVFCEDINACTKWYGLCTDATFFPKVINGAQNFINASKQAKDNPNVEILDYQINKRELLNAYFGDNGTVANQGPGGILLHFYDPSATDCSEIRQQIWDRLNQAFDLIKGMAPSTIGTDKISFRYDLLSIYRIVKDLIVFNRLQISGGDATNIIIPNNSGNYPSCSDSVIVNNNTYPYLAIESQKVEDDISIIFSVSDNNEIKNVKWTIDSSWTHWYEANYLSKNGQTQKFILTIPSDQKGKNGNTVVWIMATDESGNSTVKKERFQESVPLTAVKNKKSAEFNIKTLKEKLLLEFSNIDKKELFSVDLFSLNGRKIKSYQNLTCDRKSIKLDIGDLSNGTYLIKIMGKGYNYRGTINMSR